MFNFRSLTSDMSFVSFIFSLVAVAQNFGINEEGGEGGGEVLHKTVISTSDVMSLPFYLP